MAALAQQLGHVAHKFGHSAGRIAGDPDHSDAGIADDAALHGTKRHDDDVVLVLAEGGLALELQYADDLAGGVADADFGSQRILRAEERGFYCPADDTDGAAAADLAFGEFAAFGDRPVADRKVGVFGAHDLGW